MYEKSTVNQNRVHFLFKLFHFENDDLQNIPEKAEPSEPLPISGSFWRELEKWVPHE